MADPVRHFARSNKRRGLTPRRVGLIGLALGVLAGLAEIAHLVWFDRGVSFPRILILYAMVLDGGLGFCVAYLGGFLWTRVGRGRRRASSASVAQAGALPVSRRSFLRAAGAGMALAGAIGAWQLARRTNGRRSLGGASSPVAVGGLSRAGTARPPNILLVTIDTLRADQLGAYGHPYMRTPALDAFAAQGAKFAWHMVQQPQTNPSHASIFTGMYPASSGVRVHMVDKIPNQLQTLAKIFNQAGFATAGLFSWMSFDNQYCNFEPGFQVYQDLTTAAGSVLDKPGIRNVVAQYRLAEQYLSLPRALDEMTGLQSQQESVGKGHADITTNAAIGQLSAFGGQPFFLWLHYFDPHYPYQPPPAYLDLYDKSYQGPIDDRMSTIDAIQQGKLNPQGPDLQRLITLYQGEISYLDSQIARLFQALETTGLTEHTVVAVTGDHGESFGEHPRMDENGAFFHPHTLFNTEQRVPLLLRYPNRIRPGGTVSAPTQAIDIFPTLLELAGLSIPDQAEGRSVVGLIDGGDDGSSRASFAAMPDYVFTSVTVPGWKLIQNLANGERRLFDLVHDPDEKRDLVPSRQDEAGALGSQLEKWMKEVKIT